MGILFDDIDMWLLFRERYDMFVFDFINFMKGVT